MFDQPMRRRPSNKNPRTTPLALWARNQAKKYVELAACKTLASRRGRRFGPNKWLYIASLRASMAPQLPASALAAISGYIDREEPAEPPAPARPAAAAAAAAPPQLPASALAAISGYVDREEPAAPPLPPPAPAAPPPARDPEAQTLKELSLIHI